MNNRLRSDAHDALTGHEAAVAARQARNAAFMESERQRWARAQPAKIVGTMKFEITEEERAEINRQVADGLIPF